MKRVLIATPFFLPGYKAGGPIQSLSNLIRSFGKGFTFSVVSSAFDLNGHDPYFEINVNNWNFLRIGAHHVSIWYSSTKLTTSTWQQIFIDADVDTLFINGMYGWNFFLAPLITSRRFPNIKVIISPRGMLQPGALSVKPFKKRIYFTVLKYSGLLNGVSWHATTEDEKGDIKRLMRKDVEVTIAGNIPKSPVPMIYPKKSQGKLDLVYLSLITEKKNVLLLIQFLKNCSMNISLDILGPVKDQAYWEKCQSEILHLPPNVVVRYCGDVQPSMVQSTIAKYDAFILLTKGENFGHAIYESFSVGRPVITSFFTPWNELEKRRAGWNVDINNPVIISSLLDQLADSTNEDWSAYCKGAHQLATQFFDENKFDEAYQELFS